MIKRLLMLALFNAGEAHADRPSVESIAYACRGCHGTHGESQAGTPAIDHLSKQAFIQALHEFKSGQRQASVMDRIAKGLQDQDIEALAAFFNRPKQ